MLTRPSSNTRDTQDVNHFVLQPQDGEQKQSSRDDEDGDKSGDEDDHHVETKDPDPDHDSDDEGDLVVVAKKRKGPGGRGGAKKKPKQHESEDEAAEGGSEDDEEEKLYAACFPVSGIRVGYGSADSAKSTDTTLHTQHPLDKTDGTRLLYAHDGYYVLFRLHQHLYEVRPCAFPKSRHCLPILVPEGTSYLCSITLTVYSLTLRETDTLLLQSQRLAVARQSAASMSRQFGVKAEPESVRQRKELEIHTDFLRLFFKLLNGKVESSAFEDDCRMLLGANSYVLFTLDKLVFKIVKQVQALAADETAVKLSQLAEYEKSRGGAANFDESTYHANASVLLMDESVYRIGSLDKGQGLGLRLMDSALDKRYVLCFTKSLRLFAHTGR
jgi:paired amphipathic helix protein Sin3a